MPAPYPNTPNDFWRFVDKTDGCWNWIGASRAYRYGAFTIQGKKIAAHRFSWELVNGPIPEGLHALHKCDNGMCVRPNHLFLGTHQDNMDDKNRKGRGNQPKGSRCGNAKLTEEQALAIRSEYAAGARQIDLAAKYNIDQTTVSKIVLRIAWPHVQPKDQANV